MCCDGPLPVWADCQSVVSLHAVLLASLTRIIALDVRFVWVSAWAFIEGKVVSSIIFSVWVVIRLSIFCDGALPVWAEGPSVISLRAVPAAF